MLSATALFLCALFVCVKLVREGSLLRAILRHGLVLGLLAPTTAVGIIVLCALQDGVFLNAPGRVGLAALCTLIAAAFVLVAVRDLVAVAKIRREAKLARTAREPRTPLAGECELFDFGVGEERIVIEIAAAAPYRRAASAQRAFQGSASVALGAAQRAWALQLLAVLAVVGAAAIAWRKLPKTPSTLVHERAPAPPAVVVPERVSTVWSAPSLGGEARLVGVDHGRALVEHYNSHPASWSLHTIDLVTSTEVDVWTATEETARLRTGLHTRAGFHPVDHDLEHDLPRYASVVAASHRRDPLVAASSDAIVYAKRDGEDEPTQLWIAGRAGLGSRLLDVGHVGSDEASFSRDGKRLAWIAWTDHVDREGYSLVAARPDGSRSRVVVGQTAQFDWRADGRLVALVKEHDRECVVIEGGDTARHCIPGARLGTMAWDDRGESAVWLGVVNDSLTYQWIRLATREVLARGTLDAQSWGDAILDAGERPALFVLASGRTKQTSLLRVDLRSRATTELVSQLVTGSAGLGSLAMTDDGDVLLTERDLTKTPVVRLLRVRTR